MRIRAFFALVVVGFGLALVGCSRSVAETPAPPPGLTPLAAASPQAVASPTPKPTRPAAAEPSPEPTATPAPAEPSPTPPSVVVTPQEGMVSETEVVLSPEQADAEGLNPNPAAFYLRDARLEGTTLVVEGDKPTPCHRVVAAVQVAAEQVRVKLYTRAAFGLCIEVLAPVTATLDLTPYLDAAGAGTYTVLVNGQKAGQVTVP